MGELIVTGLATEQRAIAFLRPHPSNPRRHPERQLLVLRESLRVHGQQKPIVITPDGTILAGHGLVEAAKLEGWTHMACHVYDGPYPEAFLAMDNRSAELAEDDPQAMADLLKSLDEQGQLLAGGWYDDDLKELLAKLDLDEKKNREEVCESFVIERWLIIVECQDEAQQLERLRTLSGMGYQCRAAIS